MATFEYDVNASADDASETNAGSVDTSGNQLRISSLNTGIGFIFRDIGDDIPQGTTIDSATLTLTGGSNIFGGVYTDLFGIDSDSVAAFTSGMASYDISGRARTTAYTAFDNPSGFIPDGNYATWNLTVTTLVQEIIDRGGWGGDIGIVCIKDTCGKTASITVHPYDYVWPVPKLTIVADVATTRRIFIT